MESDKTRNGQKRGAVRRKRSAIENKSRQRSKNLQLNDTAIEWGDYDIDFPTSGSTGELELYDFLQQLEKSSRFATTRADITARLLWRLCKSSKLDLLTQLKTELLNLPQDDFILLTDMRSLKDALNRPFRIPLLHRMTTNYPSLTSCTNFGIQEFLDHLALDQDASISVYDYSIEDPLERTSQTTVRWLLSQFQQDSVRGAALNFLDIENRTRIQFCPYQIKLQDIITKLDSRKEYDKGKTGSEWETEPQREFFLLSQKHAISTIHVDTGGTATWVLILEGRKIWYFPQFVTAQTIRWFAQAGSQAPENYEGGWVKVELRAGDLL